MLAIHRLAATLSFICIPILIRHNWRRLVLKHPALPGGLIRPEWPGYRCHLLVDRLLRRYPRPALQDLATA